MTDLDEDTFKRQLFWDDIDSTLRRSVINFQEYARRIILPQYKGSEKEVADLQKSINDLTIIFASLENSISGIYKPKIRKSIQQDIMMLLDSYMHIGISAAFTKSVELAALAPEKEKRSRGGRAPRTTQMAWRIAVMPLLKEIRAGAKQLTNSGLASEAIKRWGTRKPALVGLKQLAKFIDEGVAVGNLQQGKLTNRSKKLRAPTSPGR